jgi:hypothetical protein
MFKKIADYIFGNTQSKILYRYVITICKVGETEDIYIISNFSENKGHVQNQLYKFLREYDIGDWEIYRTEIEELEP